MATHSLTLLSLGGGICFHPPWFWTVLWLLWLIDYGIIGAMPIPSPIFKRTGSFLLVLLSPKQGTMQKSNCPPKESMWRDALRPMERGRGPKPFLSRHQACGWNHHGPSDHTSHQLKSTQSMPCGAEESPSQALPKFLTHKIMKHN